MGSLTIHWRTSLKTFIGLSGHPIVYVCTYLSAVVCVHVSVNGEHLTSLAHQSPNVQSSESWCCWAPLRTSLLEFHLCRSPKGSLPPPVAKKRFCWSQSDSFWSRCWREQGMLVLRFLARVFCWVISRFCLVSKGWYWTPVPCRGTLYTLLILSLPDCNHVH